MTLRTLTSLISCLVAVTAIVGCGNKGDLYLIPDSVSQLDMESFQEEIGIDEVPVAAPVEVDDESVYVKPDKKRPASQSPASDPEPDIEPEMEPKIEPDSESDIKSGN